MDRLEVPSSVLMALWAPTPSSQGVALVEGSDGAHQVLDDRGVTSLAHWWDAQRPLTRVTALLPSPADPLPGLGAALDAGEALVVETLRRRLLLGPFPGGTSATWRVEELATGLPPFPASQARREVHAATEEAIDALGTLDLARERPELADVLTDLVTAVLDPVIVPPRLAPRRRELLERSLRLEAMTSLALHDDGAAATAWQARSRAEVLRPLQRVARHGVAAATEWWAV